MAKHRKNKKTIPYKSSGIVKYGSDKYAVLFAMLFLVIMYLMVMKYLETKFFIVYLFILLPWDICTIYCFRFCVKYDIKTREIQYRNFFKFRTIKFIDIKKVYRKSDGRTTFLIIKTNTKKIRINMCSCNGSREFSFFLKRHCPKVFED